MSFKSFGASALIKIVAACIALCGTVAISAPAMANTASADPAQASQLSAQIVAAVRSARLNSDCQSWDSYRNRRDPAQSSLNRNNQAACPVCSARRDQETNPLCRIDEAASAVELNSRANAMNACRSCEAAVAAAIQGAIATSGASPQTAQAALSLAQSQLASEGAMDGSTSAAFASVTSIVNQLASAGASTGAGAPSGPASSNSISSPPSSSGGGGYVTH